jgi:hypothetical protein
MVGIRTSRCAYFLTNTFAWKRFLVMFEWHKAFSAVAETDMLTPDGERGGVNQDHKTQESYHLHVHE